jgi:hypothetical protein
MYVTDPPCPFCGHHGVHVYRLPLGDGPPLLSWVCFECDAYGRARAPVGFQWPDNDPDEDDLDDEQ